MNSRTSNEVVASILKSAIKGATSLKIMCDSYINHAKLKKNLKVLMGNNMIEYDPQTRIFRTSDKGIDFLKVQREFEEAFSWHCNCNLYEVHDTMTGMKRTVC